MVNLPAAPSHGPDSCRNSNKGHSCQIPEIVKFGVGWIPVFPAIGARRDLRDFGKSDFYVRYVSARSTRLRAVRRDAFGRGLVGRMGREIA
jgi:hypothetical protein